MLAVVRKPRTKKPRLEIRGEIPAWIIGGLEKEFGKNLTVMDEDDEVVNIRDTDWWKKMEASDSPARSLRTYRRRDELSQAALGKKLGMSAQNIYEMEKGKRGISKRVAKKLAGIFGTSPARFI